MSKPFNTYDYDDAANLVGTRISVGDGTVTLPTPAESALTTMFPSLVPVRNERRPPSAISATLFYEGDHWQLGRGFLGQLPPVGLPGYQSMTTDIKNGFVSDNVIKDVVQTHTGGILGREPIWSFLKAEGETDRADKTSFENVTGESMVRWWNEREALRDLQKAVRITLCEGKAIRRVFFPRALTRATASTLPDALKFIYFETVHADIAGVFTDPDTQQKLGIFLFNERDNEGEVIAHCAELSFLNESGQTVCRIVKDKGAPVDKPPYELGGHLLVYEIDREALITPQVQSNQRALNLAHTMMMRNVNMAGNRERNVTNGQPPVAVQGIDTTRPTGTVAGKFNVGAGATNFINGFPFYDDEGNIKGYTNPNVSITDPSPVETFKETIAQEKEAVYSQCHQRHVLIVDKADTSGRAREVARREFERSLKETKTVLDASGRWLLEASLRLAAQVIGQTARYSTLRADFNCLIDAGEPDTEKQKTAILLRQQGGPKNQPLISDETARNMVGVEDAAAELAKIEQEAALPEAKLPESGAPAVEGQQQPQPATDTVQ